MSNNQPILNLPSVHPLNIVGSSSLYVLSTLILLLSFFPSLSQAISHNKFAQYRLDYQLASKQLAKGQITNFNASLKTLEDYPLYPYLQYKLIDRKLNRLPKKEVHHFIETYRGTPVSKKMSERWLNQLVKKGLWQQYIDDWNPAITDIRLQCWHLRAKYRTGQIDEALNATQKLWLSANSRPKACDPLFKEWIEAGYLSQDIAWQRLTLAMNAKRYTLAKYLVRSVLKDEYLALGSEYIKIHRRPQSIAKAIKILQFPKHQDKASQIIVHGLKRLARKDLSSARKQWDNYQNALPFTVQQTNMIGLALNLTPKPDQDISQTNVLTSTGIAVEKPKAIEQQIRTALSQADWSKVFAGIQSLPAEHQKSDRWQYWQARAIDELGISPKNSPSANNIYNELSKNRSFYGFLSADLMKVNYEMEEKTAPINAEATEKLKNNIAIVRALELFAVNQVSDARHEWFFGSQQFDAQLLTSAGKLAEEFGWYEKSIRSYIQAQYWDDIQIRFPLAYKSKMIQASLLNEIDTSWLFAIARQESAFSPDARSKAGALGLMQLMPGTAKQTARQIGLKYKKSDLFKPGTNIQLGSTYLKGLLETFNGNRILATTAYNAGPYRVKKWLKKTKKNLAFDAWIETIPFKETRHYVQNVLAFSVIYGYRMESDSQLVTSLEAGQAL
jgi:soluble lytic murein transglycosylase